jgi:hypothetical protein
MDVGRDSRLNSGANKSSGNHAQVTAYSNALVADRRPIQLFRTAFSRVQIQPNVAF